MVSPQKYGSVYVLRNFFEASPTGSILKKLMTPQGYEGLLTVLIKAVLCGLQDAAREGSSIALSDHAGLSAASIDKDTLQDLLQYLEKEHIFDQLFQEKARRCQELHAVALTGREQSGSAMDSGSINLLTLLDQDTAELYAATAYASAGNDWSTLESICRQFFPGLHQLPLIGDRNWSMFNVSTLLEHDQQFLLCCNDPSSSRRLREMILEEAEDLSCSCGETIPAQQAGQHALHASSREVEWPDCSTTEDAGSQQRSKVYLHFFFNHDLDFAHWKDLDTALSELNAIYAKAVKNGSWRQHEQHPHHPELSLRHYNLFAQQLIVFNAVHKRFSFDIPALIQHRFLYATRVLISNFCSDPVEACKLYQSRAEIERNYHILTHHFAAGALNTATDRSLTCKLTLAALCTELELQLRRRIEEYNEARPLSGQIKLIDHSLQATLQDLDSIEAVVDSKTQQLKICGGVNDSRNAFMKAVGVRELSEGEIIEA